MVLFRVICEKPSVTWQRGKLLQLSSHITECSNWNHRTLLLRKRYSTDMFILHAEFFRPGGKSRSRCSIKPLKIENKPNGCQILASCARFWSLHAYVVESHGKPLLLTLHFACCFASW